MAEDFSEKLVKALSDVKCSLDQMSSESRKSDWVKTGQLELANIISCDLDLRNLAQNSVEYLAQYVSAYSGKIYQVNRQEKVLDLIASVGTQNVQSSKMRLGEGVVGQCAVQGGAIALFNDQQQFSLYVSLECDNEVVGVLEFGTGAIVDAQKMEFLRTASRHIAKAIKSCQEFTQMKRLLEESKRQQEKLDLVCKNKTLFMAKVSHELRSPLTSVLLLSQKLADNDDGNLTYEQIEAASMINQTGHDLLELINDILDHSKVEVGAFKIHKASVSVRSIVESLQRQFLPVARDKELQFHIVVNDDVPLTLTTDGKRVGQILKNFLSNAFKFTSKGSVTLNIHRPPSGIEFLQDHLQVDSSLAFSISDTGLGISNEKQEHIFEAFQQADDSIDQVYGGTGLGLCISQELASMLHGEIRLESELGKGSTFTLFIPCEKRNLSISSPLEEIERAFSLIEQRQQRPIKKILVVEESIDQQKVLMKLLNTKSVESVFVGTCRNGLYQIASEIFDCVILDGQLSDMTASDFLKALSEKSLIQFPPVIVSRMKGKLQECTTSYTIQEHGSLLLLIHKNNLATTWQKETLTATAERAKILIVDDDLRNIYAISSTLKKKGMGVVLANNVKAAFERLESEPDIKLVIMNAFESIEQLRREERYADLPIIALLAKGTTEEKNRATDVGASDVLTRPVDLDLLLSSIKFWLSNSPTDSKMGQSRYEVEILQ